jgi:hypothetical protein
MELKDFLAANGLTETPLSPQGRSDQIQVFLQNQGLSTSKKTDVAPSIEGRPLYMSAQD